MSQPSRQPDLTIIYIIETVKTIVLSENLTNYIIQGTVFNNLVDNIPIGKFIINGNLNNIADTKAYNDNFVCILPEGTITWFASGSTEVQNNGVFNSGVNVVSRIVHGSGDFKYSTGLVFQNILSVNERVAYIYFDK